MARYLVVKAVREAVNGRDRQASGQFIAALDQAVGEIIAAACREHNGHHVRLEGWQARRAVGIVARQG